MVENKDDVLTNYTVMVYMALVSSELMKAEAMRKSFQPQLASTLQVDLISSAHVTSSKVKSAEASSHFIPP